MSPGPGTGEGSRPLLEFARTLLEDSRRMVMEHEFAVEEMLTKVNILRREFLHLHDYNPIEHVSSRVKSPESIFDKLERRGHDLTVVAAREHVHDIAGVRITCSFIADTFRVLDLLLSQDDITTVTVKDYITEPKPNGYRSLHAVVALPVFLSDGPRRMNIEVQIRTVAMDFWASLEHKIHYKFDGAVPEHLVEELHAAADVARDLDEKMESLHTEVHGPQPHTHTAAVGGLEDDLLLRLWRSHGGELPPPR